MKKWIAYSITSLLLTAGLPASQNNSEGSRISEQDHHESQLKQLDWLAGDWIDEGEESTIETQMRWDRHRNFLIQHIQVTKDDKRELEVYQIIGWDPVQKRIRSWTFDSDGGFGEGIWTKRNEDWVVHQRFTLSDGKYASSVNLYKQITPKSYVWESTGREVDGLILPNIGPITVVRKESAIKGEKP